MLPCLCGVQEIHLQLDKVQSSALLLQENEESFVVVVKHISHS
jgi:hypothetical protein